MTGKKIEIRPWEFPERHMWNSLREVSSDPVWNIANTNIRNSVGRYTAVIHHIWNECYFKL